MELFCAVDIRGGRCVRLRQGDYNTETVYNEDPVAVAAELATAGADWIHVVDLDGARSGKPENASTVAAIASAVNVPVQAGGGVRDATTAEAWFAAGVERLVLGTVALRDPQLVRMLARSHRIAVGLDARGREVATDGWLKPSGRSVLEVARSFADAGVDALVVTDITRDGMLGGPDLAGLTEVLDATVTETQLRMAAANDTTATDHTTAVGDMASDGSGIDVVAGTQLPQPAAGDTAVAGDMASDGFGIDVVASGGVASLHDLRALSQLRGDSHTRRRLAGVIVGKALYEQRFTVAEALTSLRQSATATKTRTRTPTQATGRPMACAETSPNT